MNFVIFVLDYRDREGKGCSDDKKEKGRWDPSNWRHFCVCAPIGAVHFLIPLKLSLADEPDPRDFLCDLPGEAHAQKSIRPIFRATHTKKTKS